MILALLFASTLLQSPVRTVEVTRGAALGSFTYWDCEDTTLDGTDPDASRGGEATLVGGPSTVILIRFGDLGRVLGSTRHIRKATLHLTMVSSGKPDLAGAARILQPWGEGPYQTINATLSLLSQGQPGQKILKPPVPKMAATWRTREAGFDNGNWQQAGAKGPLDSVSIPQAAVVATDKELDVLGLESTIQWLADNPAHNNGIALSFSSACEFASAQAVADRPRLELELDDAPAAKGPDLSITSIQRRPQGGFDAHVKNVGDAPSSGFDAIWSANGRVGSTVSHPDSLAPGQEVVLTTTEIPKADATDARSGTIGIDIKPTGPDANPFNNSLSVFSQARRIDFRIAPGVAEAAKKDGQAIEDWIEGQVRVFNETYLAQSHFSFALDGSKERIAVQSILFGTQQSPETKGDAEVVVTPEMFGDGGFSLNLERAIGSAIGLLDYSPMNVEPGSGRVALAGAADRGTQDLFGGLMGGGDTRFDGNQAGVLMIPNQPSFSAEDTPQDAEATGLLSMTDVYMLDSRIGKPLTQGLPAVSPKAVVVLARDLLNRPLSGVSLSFYQSSGSKIADGPPAFTLKLGDSGSSVIPSRDGQGVFGKLAPDGSNGLFLIKAEANGISEWGWLKAWQTVDAYARGITLAPILNLTFDLPGSPLEPDRDLASQKFVTDSTGQPADKLASIVDGDGKQTVSLGQKPGDWMEVDLGGDRTMAEIRLAAPGSGFWQSFDIVVYGTGQRPQDGLVFARERNWAFDRKNRSDGGGDAATVSFRGLPLQVRYIRIVSRSGGRGEIGKVYVTPAKVSN